MAENLVTILRHSIVLLRPNRTFGIMNVSMLGCSGDQGLKTYWPVAIAGALTHMKGRSEMLFTLIF